MKRILLCIILYVCIEQLVNAQQQRTFKVKLSTRIEQDTGYCNCPSYKSDPFIYPTICTPLDSVDVFVYKDTNLIGVYHSDKGGDCSEFSLKSGNYKMIFSKQGFATDTVLIDLVHIQHRKDGKSESCKMWFKTYGQWNIVNGTLGFCIEMYHVKKKRGVRMITHKHKK